MTTDLKKFLLKFIAKVATDYLSGRQWGFRAYSGIMYSLYSLTESDQTQSKWIGSAVNLGFLQAFVPPYTVLFWSSQQVSFPEPTFTKLSHDISIYVCEWMNRKDVLLNTFPKTFQFKTLVCLVELKVYIQY